jgi:hypothetical protein
MRTGSATSVGDPTAVRSVSWGIRREATGGGFRSVRLVSCTGSGTGARPPAYIQAEDEFVDTDGMAARVSSHKRADLTIAMAAIVSFLLAAWGLGEFIRPR